jgi:hypothetical protein
MGTVSKYGMSLVVTIALVTALAIGIAKIVGAWGLLGLILGIPILITGIVFAPLWLWWIGDGFPVAFTVAWAVGFAGTGYLMLFHKGEL